MTIAVGLGLMAFPFSSAAAFWRWIDLCEAGGVDSYWQSDRVVSREPILEPMSVMAALSGRTRRLKFGMNVISMAFREPVLLAKQCATIDMLSDGRLLPAFGIGSPYSEDWRSLGVSPHRRGRRTDEALEIMTRLWRGEAVTWTGEFFQLRDATISPLPRQRRLPLWLGGSSRAAVKRTARYGTGWIGGRESPTEAAKVVAGIRAESEALGRVIPDDHYGASFFYRFGTMSEPVTVAHLEALRGRFPDRDPTKSVAVGTTDDIVRRMREFIVVGVTKFVLRPIGAEDEDLMIQTRQLIEQLLPEIDSMNG